MKKALLLFLVLPLLVSAIPKTDPHDPFFSAFDIATNVTSYWGGYEGPIVFTATVNCLNETPPEKSDVFFGDQINVTMLLSDDLGYNTEVVLERKFYYDRGCKNQFVYTKEVNFTGITELSPIRMNLCMRQMVSRVWKCSESRYFPSVLLKNGLTNSTTVVNLTSQSEKSWIAIIVAFTLSLLFIIAGLVVIKKFMKLQLGMLLLFFGLILSLVSFIVFF